MNHLQIVGSTEKSVSNPTAKAGGLASSMVKNVILVIMTLVIAASSHCLASAVLVEDIYTAEQGDSLETIAVMYMNKNTYGPRELREFESGIVQLNPWLLERELQPGDEVRINYWVEDRDN